MIEAYPLYWPDGRPRTPFHRQEAHRQFKGTFAKYRDGLLRQVELLGGKRCILSTNIPLRNDGLPYANTREPDDSGVALYFKYKDKDMCFAADRYKYARQNIHAIALTIAAIRAIERYGTSDMMERAFRGFTALPEQSGEYWREVLEIPRDAKPTPEHIERAFRAFAFIYHPDHGGTTEEFTRLCLARENALRDIGAIR